MNIETCKKYLGFVYRECDRFLKDGRVTDEELNKLIIEFHRFLDQVAESSLPSEIKDKIANLQLAYPRTQITRGYGYMFSVAFTLGIWALISANLRQRKRKRVLENLKSDTADTLILIKRNY
ncbi:MAG: hypothetical protein KJO53_15910 [Eudoraea sp.]|nr:hypothetical protein [Eudoraea sp.]MBT8292193.1 hypothetical protein [Eudoraea sp.]